LLGLFVVMVGIQLGGGLYEKRVVVPQWSTVAPSEVGPALARSGQEASARSFWAFVSPPVALLAVANLVAAWRAKRSRRRALWLAASATMVLYSLSSYGYFVPTMIRLWQAETLPPAEVESTVYWWVRLNYLRSLLGVAALVAALRALALPAEGAGQPAQSASAERGHLPRGARQRELASSRS
jgi:hypothetical protein